MAEKQKLGGTAIKPVGWDRSGFEAFQYMLYNPDTGEILTRTPLSWLKIIVFYCIYYTFLAGFWGLSLYVFFTTVPIDQPKWLLDESIIGSNPGVGLRPTQMDKLIDSSIFTVKVADTDRVPTDEDGEGPKNIDYAVRAQKFLEKYENVTGLQNCDGEQGEITDGRSCIFDLAVLGECADFPYGFVSNEDSAELGESKYAEPCIFVKFNKIFNWIPTPIQSSNMTQTLEDPAYNKMSDQLKNIIVKSSNRDFVWVDCFGRFAADQEAFLVDYYPANQGIPIKYFPFHGGSYHQPLVAIKLRENKAAWGQLQHLECRAWFEGVTHNTKDKIGLVQFEAHLLAANEHTRLN